ncbi:hypothetical protein GCM10019017_47190 [Streptomyces showdoensis]
MLAGVRGGFGGPQGAHQVHRLAGVLAAGGPGDAVVVGLLAVPAEAHAEGEAPAGEVVEGGDALGEGDRVVLADQGDAGAEQQVLGDGRGLAERDEGIEDPGVLGRQRAAVRIGRGALGGDVGVLGQVEPGEAALFELAGEPHGGDGLVGQEDRGRDPHDGTVGGAGWNSEGCAALPCRVARERGPRAGVRRRPLRVVPPFTGREDSRGHDGDDQTRAPRDGRGDRAHLGDRELRPGRRR